MIRALARYAYWARHARARQLLFRPRRLLPVPLVAAGLRRQRATPWAALAAGLGVDPAPQGGAGPAPHETGAFEAYGVARRREAPAFWRDDRDGLLFLFHLHGFAALANYAAGARTARADRFWQDLVEEWLARHERPRRPAWHPYPTSLRVIAWSAAASAIDGWAPSFRDRVAAAVLRQGRYVRRTIEHDIGGNHVLKNATALAFAGALHPGTGLLDAGLRLLERELSDQLLADGGHVERSTSYHRQVTHDLAEVSELLRRADRPVPGWLEDAAAHTRAWQAAMTAPDGALPLLNDAWEGPPVTGRLRDDMTALADTGYVVLRDGADQAVLDVGDLAPPYLPPHAHADALSFVLWLDGAPLVVDPGSYTYSGELRDAYRGTAAHNTVQVDAADQCELWGDFRAAFLPDVTAEAPRRVGELILCTARHDGYRRLDDPVEHERTFVWWPGTGMVVVDRLHGRTRHEARSRLHLAPGLTATASFRVGGYEITPLGPAGERKSTGGWYAPALGTRVPITVLEHRVAIEPGTPFGWSVLRDGARGALEGRELRLTREGSPAHTVSLWPGK